MTAWPQVNRLLGLELGLRIKDLGPRVFSWVGVDGPEKTNKIGGT
jgi:hypothetical protein